MYGAAEPTPEEERRLEADSLRAELAWILGSECPAVFARLASLLQGCLAQLQDASATSNRNEPLRGESHDGALRFALTAGSRDLQALQMHFVLPKWNRGLPYKAALAGGRRFSLVLPQLLTLHNKLGQAVAALSDGSAVVVTTARYETPKRTNINKLGIAPNIERACEKGSDALECLGKV